MAEKKLVAIYPILYCAHQYKVGDELPTTDSGMIKAWLEAKTADWKEEKSKAEQQELSEATAIPVTAMVGMEGESGTGEKDFLVGRVPIIPEREKPKVGRVSIRKTSTKTAAKEK